MSDEELQPPDNESGSNPARAAGSSCRILVVEDEASIRRMVMGMLSNSGYQVDAAEDGAQAWNALQVNHYDLLITDNNMPNVSGVELLQRLHATHMELPVIMATATLPSEEFARNPCLEPAATLLKPYSIAALMETVKAVLCAVSESHKQIDPSSDWSQTSTDALQL